MKNTLSRKLHTVIHTTYKLMRKLLGKRFICLCHQSISMPCLFIRELYRLFMMIYYKNRFFEDPEVLLAALRISAHVLDKSLQADNWMIGRGKAQYVSLCEYADFLKDSVFSSDPSFKWAMDKKREYEESQLNEMNTQRAYLYNQQGINKSQLKMLIKGRRSIRSFSDKKIEHDILIELADIVNWSATSCNRQPAKLFITQNTKKINACLKQCAGATCLSEKAPCFIAVCADIRFYMLKDYNLPFIDVSLGLQNMLLLAHLQGIEATILNWMHHTHREDKIVRQTLNISGYYMIILNLILGYPLKTAPIPGRKDSNLTTVLVN